MPIFYLIKNQKSDIETISEKETFARLLNKLIIKVVTEVMMENNTLLKLFNEMSILQVAKVVMQKNNFIDEL